MNDPLQEYLQGRISAETAITRLLLQGEKATLIRRRVDDLRNAGPAWRALHRLAQQADLERLECMLRGAGVRHDVPTTPEAIAALFDRAVEVSPEASVALYSLGDRNRLDAGTGEVVDWLRKGAWLRAQDDVLDLGCGIGRVAAAVAPHVRRVIGTEVSAGMLRVARLRCGSLPNVSFVLSSGRDVAMLADASFNLVLAVDSFPYLVQAGVAEVHMTEMRRILRSGGRLVILNLSYRTDPALDRQDAESWAARFGFVERAFGIAPFHNWDARAYLFERR